MSNKHVGLIGLGVMGSHLAQNIERNGYTCSVYDKSDEARKRFESETKGRAFEICGSIKNLVKSLPVPRVIILLVPAGKIVDSVIDGLTSELSEGDIILDGGNSYFEKTNAREARCSSKGILLLGTGISGGEKGALLGPSIMPGGERKAFEHVKELLESIAAKADGPCTTYIGPQGSGHFVKMVHNGIEYGVMQLLAESYDLLKRVGSHSNEEISELFNKWNSSELESFLMEITAKLLKKADDKGSGLLIDKILDKAGQKGTGRWTVQTALDLGIAVPTISAALEARILSSMKDIRVTAERFSTSTNIQHKLGLHPDELEKAFIAANIILFSQGLALMQAASEEFNWQLNLSEIARIWKGGCIIRARVLNEIQKVYLSGDLKHFLLDSEINAKVDNNTAALQKVVSLAAMEGIPAPAFSTALSYWQAFRTARLPQNIIQAQRDFFGSHTYQRIDQEGKFHTEWE